MDSKAPIILDASSGFREMWLDKDNSLVVFLDQRDDAELAKDFDAYNTQRGRRGRRKWLPKNLTVEGDFRKLDFPDGRFKAVNWDPPHLKWLGEKSLFKKKYGELNAETWPDDIKRGAKELFRVLEPGGFLFFKWNDNNISVKTVLKLFPCKPLFCNMNSGAGTSKHGKPSHTYWCIFMKPLEASS
jgi:SAM-dependent methyltransferase